MQTLQCQLHSMEKMNDSVFQVLLEPESPVQFKAGQYLAVIMGEGDFRPFSIASVPHESELLELHIGATPDNPYAWEVINQLKESGTVNVQAPGGEAWYRNESHNPIILIAGGTGFSYAWSIARTHLDSDSDRPVTFYWGARKREDLYFHNQLQSLADKYDHFYYRPVLENPPENWDGATGLVHQAVLADFPSLRNKDIYIAGRFDMVKVVREDFAQYELSPGHLFGDALSFI